MCAARRESDRKIESRATESWMSLDLIDELPFESWDPASDAGNAAADSLERGRILYLPRLRFELAPAQARFLAASWSDGRSKNIYLRGANRRLRGARGSRDDLEELRAMLERFAQQAQRLVAALLPRYRAAVGIGNTSFRPCEIEGRPSSWRKDDRRLHTDSFPSDPTHGARLLRVFTNVNPAARPRVWRVGEPFRDMAARFLPRARGQLPGEAALLRALRITKRPRSEYDHLMNQLHDRVKADIDYQRNAPAQRIEFPAGSTWIVFSDQVLHAALSGQFMLEQTWRLPVAAIGNPDTAPLRVLERLVGHALV
jgi:hypothetical protein